MTLEEKVDQVLEKINEKKTRDKWDKTQIVATICLGVFTFLLAIANLLVTRTIATQTQIQADNFHQDQIAEQKNEKIRRERDELIQELAILPDISNMLESDDPKKKRIAIAVIKKINKNPLFDGHIFLSFADQLEEEKEAAKQVGTFYATSTTKDENPFWVYLGQKENDKWQACFFNIDVLPTPNTVIKSVANVYKHDKKPIEIDHETDTWDFGRTLGVIKSGSTVTVLETLTLEGNNYWARVK